MVFADAKTCALVKSLPKIEIRGRLMRHVTMKAESTKVARLVPTSDKPRPLNMRTEFPQDCNLVIKNLCPSITEDKFYQLFAKFGKITSMRIIS